MEEKLVKVIRNAVMPCEKRYSFEEVCHCEETSSPPSSMPRPSVRPFRVSTGLLVGGMRLSKFNFRLASLAAAGVLLAMGVRLQDTCAGLGETLTKSAKLKFVPGVFGPKPKKEPPFMPGVMCDDGRGVDLQGGVEGGCITAALLVRGLSTDGEAAR